MSFAQYLCGILISQIRSIWALLQLARFLCEFPELPRVHVTCPSREYPVTAGPRRVGLLPAPGPSAVVSVLWVLREHPLCSGVKGRLVLRSLARLVHCRRGKVLGGDTPRWTVLFTPAFPISQ